MELALFAVTPPGVEEITAAELRALGVAKAEATRGGVEFQGTLDDLFRANLELRTATRVLLRIGSFPARGFDPLRRRAARLPWERFLAEGDALALRVTCRKSRLYHSGAVAQRLREAIAERLGFAPPPQPVPDDAQEAEPESRVDALRSQLVLVRIEHDLCTVSVDASGEPLHRRGHRQSIGKAPLRETLAAALLLASGWDAESPLLDPFCGAGTIPIEAALLARRRAPGRARRFAFESWRDFDALRWAALLAAADARSAAGSPRILASDRDAGAVAATRANAQRAGVEGDLEVSQRAISALEVPAGPGWIVTNPPHGVRLSRRDDLRNLYARLGQVLRARCGGWHVALLTSGTRLVGAAGLALEPQRELLHGGLRLTLFTGRVPEGA
jgi:putative N6-adenine-specific DNA methylase